MARKKVKKTTAKKTAAKKKTAKTEAGRKKTTKKKAAKSRGAATTEPTGIRAANSSVKPFEVCNHFGVHLRDVFEKEHSQNRQVQLGEVFEYLLGDLDGAWKMLKLYGKEMPVEKLRGKSNPFNYDL